MRVTLGPFRDSSDRVCAVLRCRAGTGHEAGAAPNQTVADAVDMTEAMLEKTRVGAAALGLSNVEARHGYAEELPVEAGSIDVVISNGVINLCPDKMAVMAEIHRVLKPGGRIRIADIVVQKEVPQDAKDDIDLWSG